MSRAVFLVPALVNCGLALLIWPEIQALPTFWYILEARAGLVISNLLASLFFAALIGIIPLLISACVLAYFKRYIFSHQKPIVRSYNLVTTLLYLSYMAFSLIYLLEFILSLAYNHKTYIFVRVAALYTAHFLGQTQLFVFVTSLLAHIATFILFFLAAELFVAYRHYNTQFGFKRFLLRNLPGAIPVAAVSLAYCILFVYLESVVATEHQTARLYRRAFENIHYGVLVNLALVYIYILLGLYQW